MKVQGRRQSKNIVDARGPENELRYYTKVTMEGAQRARMHQQEVEPMHADRRLNQHIRANPVIVLRNILQRGTLNPVGERFRIPTAAELQRQRETDIFHRD